MKEIQDQLENIQRKQKVKSLFGKIKNSTQLKAQIFLQKSARLVQEKKEAAPVKKFYKYK